MYDFTLHVSKYASQSMSILKNKAYISRYRQKEGIEKERGLEWYDISDLVTVGGYYHFLYYEVKNVTSTIKM